TGKPLAGVSVRVQETGDVAITDERGEFSFPAAAGPVHLTASDPAYQRADASADAGHGVDIALEAMIVGGEKIVVVDERVHETAGEQTLEREEIEHAPGARGDALQAIKNLPGIANDGLGFGSTGYGLIIRGGAPADSRIYVDGFAIPILYHF